MGRKARLALDLRDVGFFRIQTVEQNGRNPIEFCNGEGVFVYAGAPIKKVNQRVQAHRFRNTQPKLVKTHISGYASAYIRARAFMAS